MPYLLAIRRTHTRAAEMRSRYFNKGTRFIITAPVHTFTMLLETKGDGYKLMMNWPTLSSSFLPDICPIFVSPSHVQTAQSIV